MLIEVIEFDQKVGLGTFSGWLTGLRHELRYWRAQRNELPRADAASPIILLGGYMGVNERERLPYLQRTAEWVAQVVETERPLLAICLGGQLLAHALGARVQSQARQERGIGEIRLTAAGLADPLFAGLPDPFVSFEWHNDSFELPAGSTHLARTETCPGQAFRYRNAWGLQFHPEVDEQVVADWCQRTAAGDEPLTVFRQHQARYFAHSRGVLENFAAFSGQRPG